MSTFSETAREIVVDFWTYADKVSEAIAQWKKATGQYTAEYIHTQVLQLEQQSLDAKYRAERKLAALREKYETTAAAYYAPNGAVLDTADAKLLRTDFPMDLDQFRALCERNKDNAWAGRDAAGEPGGGLYCGSILKSKTESIAGAHGLRNAFKLCNGKFPGFDALV